MVYPEASLLVSAVSDEVASEAARAWLASTAPSELMTSGWCETEIVSALAVRVRRRELSREASAATVAVARDLVRSSTLSIPVIPEHFSAATELILASSRALRAGDALHLAIARLRGAILWILDRKMAEAGQALGLGTRLLA